MTKKQTKISRNHQPKPTVSVIIPTVNRSATLKTTLSSLHKLDYPANRLEIIVVNNGSTDDTVSMLTRSFPKVKIINLSENRGVSKALNMGIRKAEGKLIFVTNDDVIFDKLCLSELTKLMQTDPHIGIVGGRMYYKSHPEIMPLPGFRVNLWLGYHPYDRDNQDKVRESDIAPEACILLRKKALLEVGAYDEGYFWGGGDYDICFKIKAAGYRILYCPTAIIWHEFLSSSKTKDNFHLLYSHFKGKFRFMLAHASLAQLAVFLPIQLLIGPPLSYFQSRKKTLLPILAALLWTLIHLPAILANRKQVQLLKNIQTA